MNELHVSRLILILALLLNCVLVHQDLHAKDPCGAKQTQSGEVVSNEDMEIQWAPGQPVDQFDSNGEALLEVIGGTGEYVWEIDQDDDAAFGNEQKIDSTYSPDLTNTVMVGGSADCSVTVTVSNKGKTLSPAHIAQIPKNFSFDVDRTGWATIARNSSKNIYVSGGIPPFTWTVSTPGFFFDSDRTTSQITTDSRSITLFTDGTACGTADINVRDDCDTSSDGIVRCSAGKWGDYKLVAQVMGSDIGCPGCDNCWMNTPTRYDICPDISPFSYKVQYCHPYSAYGCESPGCGKRPQPVCNNKGQACSMSISDGICSYSKISEYCTGYCWMKLSRKEWVCN